jgi:hypothetical protein
LSSVVGAPSWHAAAEVDDVLASEELTAVSRKVSRMTHDLFGAL